MNRPALFFVFLLFLGSCSEPGSSPTEEQRCEWKPFGKILVKDCKKEPTLPEKCEHLRRDPDPATWNPDTEEYPPNREWEACMGVERKPRVM
tara:strand:+ start:301 stop:576 length:276 start_codon:yes stop_codon:yes gene_type:complete